MYPSKKELDKIVAPRESNQPPEGGDVIIYYDEQDPNRAIHFGILGPEGKILSKWGTGDVYEHQWDKSPYGTNVKYYKPQERNKPNLEKLFLKE